ncbi:MAG: hypothetical protein ACK2T7_14420, partial [Anaerolineales bacterium]
MKRTLIFIVSVFLLALTASSCGGADASSTAPSPYSAYEIDPLFWTYFKKSGGTDLFGPVISTLFTNPAGEKQQFTEAGLLVFSPQENRYYFASLGLDLNLSEPPDDTQAQSGDLVINGYRIHPALVSFYHELGRDLVGAPISNPHYNYAKNRLEQHFENLGIYYLLDDPEKTPHLLAYGMVACTSCQAYPGPIDLRPMEPISDGTFLNFIYSNGVSRDLLGDVLKGPTLLTDGSTEMVFEHMVLSGKDGQISIQPLPQQVGYGAAELYTPIKSQILTFIPVKDNTGHNVLNAFNNFINQN